VVLHLICNNEAVAVLNKISKKKNHHHLVAKVRNTTTTEKRHFFDSAKMESNSNFNGKKGKKLRQFSG